MNILSEVIVVREYNLIDFVSDYPTASLVIFCSLIIATIVHTLLPK